MGKARTICSGIWGGALGFVVVRFVVLGDWGMVAFCISFGVACFWLVLWMIGVKYD